MYFGVHRVNIAICGQKLTPLECIKGVQEGSEVGCSCHIWCGFGGALFEIALQTKHTRVFYKFYVYEVDKQKQKSCQLLHFVWQKFQK